MLIIEKKKNNFKCSQRLTGFLRLFFKRFSLTYLYITLALASSTTMRNLGVIFGQDVFRLFEKPPEKPVVLGCLGR